MNPSVHYLSLALFLMVPKYANAQESTSSLGQQGSSASEAAQLSSGTPEESSIQSGGLLGMGGQKPMQRVRGVPLPTRPSRQLYAASQFSAEREMNPTNSVRRSKQMIGPMTTDFPARMIYLNGKNVSTIREQKLDGVNVRIDSQGNVHILAPHYEVQESTHYRPLLPDDVPRVSKPSSGLEEPLLFGRQNKPSGQPDGAKNRQPIGGEVPPIADDKEEAAGPAASAKASQNAEKSAQEQREKLPEDGRKL